MAEIQQSNFHNHPLMRMRQAPKIEVYWRKRNKFACAIIVRSRSVPIVPARKTL